MTLGVPRAPLSHGHTDLIPSSRKYKTELCENWAMTGLCTYFDRVSET